MLFTVTWNVTLSFGLALTDFWKKFWVLELLLRTNFEIASCAKPVGLLTLTITLALSETVPMRSAEAVAVLVMLVWPFGITLLTLPSKVTTAFCPWFRLPILTVLVVKLSAKKLLLSLADPAA